MGISRSFLGVRGILTDTSTESKLSAAMVAITYFVGVASLTEKRGYANASGWLVLPPTAIARFDTHSSPILTRFVKAF
jgi:hypothetical protein